MIPLRLTLQFQCYNCFKILRVSILLRLHSQYCFNLTTDSYGCILTTVSILLQFQSYIFNVTTVSILLQFQSYYGCTIFFRFRNVNQEREAKLGMRERGNTNPRTQKYLFEQECGKRRQNLGTRKATAKSRNMGARHAKGLQERAPSSGNQNNIQKHSSM